MTELIIVRHGQSIANAEKKFAGHSNFDLSDTGHAQASLVADYLVVNKKIDAIYSSDLLRAYNTVAPTAKRLGLKIQTDKKLREIYAGEWEAMTFEDIATKYEKDFNLWKNDFSNARPTGGESVEEIYYRVRDAVLNIAKANDGKTVLIGTHATVVRSFECFARGLGAEHMCDVPFCANAAINIFECDGVCATPVSLNFKDHLGGQETFVPKEINA